ncbi:hypothetical protein FOL47_007662 [Perkinsus chesapeaki]|uniref:Uncharacterized protein n=1 Tax=Perkinsus chesapeaki TaxID=330153 RepID=A0A7J6MVI2_PERCH|nr:hypothetical protein FOL47_007662 [Perkinsus chesapeaki]
MTAAEAEPSFKSSAGVRFRRAFEYTAMGFCIAFNTFLFLWGLASVITSTLSLLQHNYIGSVASIFLTLLFAMLMVATSIYGCRALGSKDLSKQIRYICMATILVILYTLLLASQSMEYIAIQAIDQSGANVYDNQTASDEYEVLNKYRKSFISSWHQGNCSGGECLVEGCLEDPPKFEPVTCTAFPDLGGSITSTGQTYNRSHEYFLQCVSDQLTSVTETIGMIDSLCYTRESAVSSTGKDALTMMILLAVAIGSMILAVISVIVLVTRPHTWQDDDFHFVSDREMFAKSPTSLQPGVE